MLCFLSLSLCTQIELDTAIVLKKIRTRKDNHSVSKTDLEKAFLRHTKERMIKSTLGEGEVGRVHRVS